MAIKKRILEGFLYIFGGRTGAGIITIAITPIIVRILGSGGYGDYAFAIAVYSTLRTVSGGGIYEGARKYIAEREDAGHRSAVFRYYLNVAVLFGFSVSALLVLTAYLVVGNVFLAERLRGYLLLVAVLVFLHPFFYLVRSSLMGYELERYSEPLIVLDKVFLALVGVTLAYIGWHVTGMLIGHITALAVIIVLGVVAIYYRTDISLADTRVFVSAFSDIYESRMFRYSMLTIVFVSLTKSLYTVDIILLQPFSGSQEVGYYRAALLVAEFLWFVPYAVQVVLLHSASKLWAEDRIREIDEISSNITRYTLVLAGVMAISLAVVGDSFMPIYFGPEFTVSYLPMLLLLPGVVCFAIARPIYAVGQGHGDIKLLVISTAVAASINLVLNLALIPPFGMYGAAVATSIGYASMLFLHNWAAGALGFHPLRNIRPLRIAAAGLLVLPPLWYLDTMISTGVSSLVVVTPVGVVLFGLLVWVFGAVSSEEMQMVKRTAFG